MNVGPDSQSVDSPTPGRIRSLWTSGRLTLFCCVMLSGLALEAYCIWFRFAAHCGALVPFPLFLAVLLIPAAASIIFAGNLYYRGFSLSVWGLYGLACLGWIATNERLVGVCYRETMGDADTEMALVLSTVIFAIAIVSFTFVFGMLVLVQKFYAGWRPRFLSKAGSN
jgi:hypothetical protein